MTLPSSCVARSANLYTNFAPDASHHIIRLENSWFQLLKQMSSTANFMAQKNSSSGSSSLGTCRRQANRGLRINTWAKRVTNWPSKGQHTRFRTTIQLKAFTSSNSPRRNLAQSGLSSNIVEGLAAFDPHILFNRPIDVRLRHFDLLYSNFRLQTWVPLTMREPVEMNTFD